MRVLKEINEKNKEAMFVAEGPGGDSVRRPGAIFNHREHHLSAAQCTPDSRESIFNVNRSSVPITQLQNQIEKLTTEIDQEETMKASLSEFIWAILYSISPLDTSSTAGTEHSPSRKQLLVQVAELLASEEGAEERAAVIKELGMLENVFPALCVSFLKRAQHGTANRCVPFPPILLHASLLIGNTSPAAYAKLAPMFHGALPVARTLRSYNDTGDFTSGVNPSLYRKIHDLVLSSGATGQSLHGILSCDELSTIDVCKGYTL